ncbi:CLUMA_CG009489, isoform A [Clunio marinus]|uniref:CLUMA_CG009489, isoform A n=1 Tax=Clunio marinus TaxID=568069 RepID=A0A1J1I917_9DIPT|nr:CLUMA_CG009489, isoform A [Clunio marinus]
MKTFSCITRALLVIYFFSAQSYGEIPGYTAGIDYPNYSEVPKGGSFSCANRLPGYYADMETRCQVWHWCLHSGLKFDFLCPNGTVFNQEHRVCDWFYNVNCAQAEDLYLNNEELYKDAQGNPI